MPRKTSPPRPTDGELEILQVLWQQGPSTVRQVQTVLNRRKRTGYTTVLKLMQIMAAKGLLVRNESQRSHVYRPQVPADKTQRQLVADLTERVFRGSAQKLVMQALSSKNVSRAELCEIRAAGQNGKGNPMNSLAAFLTGPLAERFGWALLHFVWEGAAIAALLAVALRALRRRPAAARYRAGWFALVAMAGAIPLTAWFATPSPARSATEVGSSRVGRAERSPTTARLRVSVGLRSARPALRPHHARPPPPTNRRRRAGRRRPASRRPRSRFTCMRRCRGWSGAG